MSNTSSAAAEVRSIEQLLKTAPELQSQATIDGLSDLITRVAPLLQGRRLNNIVDLLAAMSDVVEMTDYAMVQKLMAAYENGIGGVWAVGNSLRYAAAQAAQAEEPPTAWQSLRRLRKDKDARRGLDMAINLMSEMGRQARAANGPMPED